jgi:hypothetical protein
MVESTPIDRIDRYTIERGRLVTTLRLKTSVGTRVYQMLNRSLGTGRFAAAVERTLGGAPQSRPLSHGVGEGRH